MTRIVLVRVPMVVLPGGYAPTRATDGAAGWDLYAPHDLVVHANEDGFRHTDYLTVSPGCTVRIDVRVSVAIPPGYVGLICGRSGLGSEGLQNGLGVGVIDQDYRGSLSVVLHNARPFHPSYGDRVHVIRSGDRIAQLLVLPCPEVELAEVTELPPTARGVGGFGSTGR